MKTLLALSGALFLTASAAQGSFEDQLGFSFDIPLKTQKLVELKTAAVESAAYGGKISVTGRIAQDIEDVTEVFTAESGRLKESAPVGSRVARGQVIGRIEKRDSSVLDIQSPVEGIILAEYSRPGSDVDTISPVYTIGSLYKLSANFDIYEQDMGKISTGQEVAVYSTAYGNRSFKGRIIFVSPRVDESSFTVRIKVEIGNPELLLKPGMFVRGEILVSRETNSLIVPTDAVQNIDGVNVVFLQEEEESFTPTKVDIKYASKHHTLVLASLKAGARVVTQGSYVLKSKILENEIAGGCSH